MTVSFKINFFKDLELYNENDFNYSTCIGIGICRKGIGIKIFNNKKATYTTRSIIISNGLKYVSRLSSFNDYSLAFEKAKRIIKLKSGLEENAKNSDTAVEEIMRISEAELAHLKRVEERRKN